MTEAVNYKFAKGDEVKDIITGFKGIVISQTSWFNGCVRYLVQSQKLGKDNDPEKGAAFDEAQLELVKGKKVKTPTAEPVAAKSPGGPRNDQFSPVRDISRR